MIEEILDGLVVVGLAAGGGRRRRRAQPARVLRPAWWKGMGAGLLLVQQVPLVVGAAWFLKVGFEFGRDDFLLFVGLFVFALASVLATVAVVLAAWAVTIAIRVTRDHGYARWYLGGFGLGGLVAVVPVLGVDGGHPLVVLFVAASVALLAVAIGAPADERR